MSTRQDPGFPQTPHTGSDAAVERSTMRKVTMRLLPLLFLAYLLNFLDRTNIGIAKLAMSDDLGLSEAAFGLGAGIFFIGYAVFEVPSNLILEKVGPRVWIARIMITWGLVATAFAWVDSEAAFYVLRFLLGVAEAGFVPGVLLYLQRWAPKPYRARFISLFLVALPLASVVGNPLGGWLLDQSWFGLESWKLLFVVEGVPTVVVGIVVLFVLTSRPAEAHWLEPEERRWLTAETSETTESSGRSTRSAVLEAARSPRVLAMCLIYFGTVVPVYALAFFLPSMLVTVTGGGLSSSAIGWLAAIPYGVTALALVLISRRSDLRGERRLHYAVPALVGSGGLVVAALSFQLSAWLVLIGITLGLIGCIATAGAFWSEASVGLVGAAAATGIAMVNTLGNVGGFASPYAVGWIIDGAGQERGGSIALLLGAVFLGAAALLMCRVGTRTTMAGPDESRIR